jgi:hypothetical protein
VGQLMLSGQGPCRRRKFPEGSAPLCRWAVIVAAIWSLHTRADVWVRAWVREVHQSQQQALDSRSSRASHASPVTCRQWTMQALAVHGCAHMPTHCTTSLT